MGGGGGFHFASQSTANHNNLSFSFCKSSSIVGGDNCGEGSFSVDLIFGLVHFEHEADAVYVSAFVQIFHHCQ